MKKKDTTSLVRRLSLRLSEQEYTRLCQIGLTERTRSEGETIRRLIALYWLGNAAEVRREVARADRRGR